LVQRDEAKLSGTNQSGNFALLSKGDFVMSHLLPPQGHPARELFDVQTLVDVATGKEMVRTRVPGDVERARMFAELGDAARRVVFFRVRADDTLELCSIGRRGGYRRHWSFGPCGPNVRLS
jgi:hypothetical protein